jgi:hypothetical protein
MQTVKHLTPALLAATLLTLSACDSDGNSYSGSGTLQLAAGDLDSTMVYAHVDSSKDPGVTYENDLYVGSSSYPEFQLAHYVCDGQFAGGLTATNQTDSTTLAADNYAAITGHGAASNATYFVGDLRKQCSITFRTDALYGEPLTPQFIMVSNAAYTYLAMAEGCDLYPAFTAADYLELHIYALDKKGGAIAGREVVVDLASKGKLLKEWKKVDLTELGECYGVYFNLEATDGTSGLSVPVPPRFCFDFLTANYNYSFSY